MARPKTAADKKTERISLVLPTALYADVVRLSQIRNTSLNQLFCTLAMQAVKKNRSVIDEINAAMEAAFPKSTLDVFDEPTATEPLELICADPMEIEVAAQDEAAEPERD